MITPNVLADHDAVSERAAEWIAERLESKPSALLCLATGATPMRSYELLARRAAAAPSLVEHVRILKLDEWGGLARDDPATCEQHLRRALVDPLRLDRRYIALNGEANDPQAECERVASWLALNGPIDACVLGLGVNGHLGFNEPGDYLQPHAHVAELSEASLAHAMVRDAPRPSCGLTLGMADLLQARDVLLVVTGAAKRGPLRQLLAGRITTKFPASLLWLHPSVTLLCDEAAYDRTGGAPSA